MFVEQINGSHTSAVDHHHVSLDVNGYFVKYLILQHCFYFKNS